MSVLFKGATEGFWLMRCSWDAKELEKYQDA